MKRTLIKNARVYDGTGTPSFLSDVLIEGSIIKTIAQSISPQEGDAVVEAAGLALSPGFINTHSHMELEIFKHPALPSVIQQGITTEVLGQDGSSVAPLTDGLVEELADNMAPLAGTLDRPYSWRSFGEYMAQAAAAKPAARFVSLVGHGTIRMNIMGNDNREPTPAEMAAMQDLLARCMEEGAKGLSFGLIYPPGSYGNTPELIEMAKVVARYDGIIMVHVRNEKDLILDSVDEMMEVVKATGVRMHISHHKVLGKANWGKIQTSLAKLDAMNAAGYEVRLDQYPFIAGCTGLKVCVPPWAYAGGEQGFQARLRDPVEYEKVLKDTHAEMTLRGGAEVVMIASVTTEEYKWMEGLRMHEIAPKLGMEPAAAILHILQHEGPAVVAIYFSISEEEVRLVMKSPWHCLCTDGIMGAKPHPRTFSSFPRFLGTYVREQQVMPLEEAIRHITGEPARRLRLWDRGLIRQGMDADLVLFDPATIKDTNSFTEPEIQPVGIHKVWVLGEEQFSL